jgi:hypothetical protein
MSVSVVKEGPYFSSGSISFSLLRSRFKETSGGSISASELRRNTNIREENPIVPDSTENEQISTGSNLALSQFRNSIKRYFATQSGTDTNSSYPDEPGFRMGRFDPNGRGIDWSGGGFFGRDGQGGGTSGNLTKNVQKNVSITGTCGGVRFGLPAAQLSPVVQVHNVRINVSGSILGYGGLGGYDPRGFPFGNQSGENGGVALNLGNIGYNNRVYVQSSARIYGGGGGGEQGQNGGRGSVGTCSREYSNQQCGGNASCNQGGSVVGTYGGNCCESYCTGWPRCRERCSKWLSGVICRISQPSTTPIQGIGGRGGNGQGYNQSRSSGQDGSAGTCPTCPSGLSLSGGECATNGGRGGDGGDWGQDGGETSGQRSRGFAGAAINRDAALSLDTYIFEGTNNSNTIRGAINL